MDVNISYNVVTTGELADGFSLEQVQEAFAELFKCSEAKAKTVVGKRVTLKKNLDISKATAYQRHLQGIGLQVHLEEVKPQSQGIVLSLEPLEQDQSSAPKVSGPPNTREQRTQEQNSRDMQSATMICPKCNLEQKRADQCEGCGVYIHKVLAAREEPLSTAEKDTPESEEDSASAVFVSDGISPKAIGAAAVVAVLGAFLWKFIAMEFDRELGLIAWLIGGAVGFAAASLGSRGQPAGILCGVLTVLAILGGKYLFYSDLQANIRSVMEEIGTAELMQASYEQMKLEAAEFVSVNDDQGLREFMVRYEYSEHGSPEAVTVEEINIFRDEFEADLVYLASNNPSYDEWMNDTVAPEVESVSTTQVVYESLGWLDLLFLLFGVATAYRLGSQERSA